MVIIQWIRYIWNESHNLPQKDNVFLWYYNCMNIVICDDSKSFNEDLQKKVRSYPFDEQVTISIYYSGKELLKTLDSDNNIDIVFMDIDLGQDENGIDIALAIKSYFPAALIIYISSFQTYYIPLANAEPFAFLEKPLSEEGVHQIIEKAVNRIESTTKKYFYFVHKGERIKVDLADVLYIQSSYKRILLKTAGGEKYEFWGKLLQIYEEIEKIYPFFIQINRSTIINHERVDAYRRTEVKIGGEVISVGKTYDAEYVRKSSFLMKQQ